MVQPKIEHGSIGPIYRDTGNSLGYYRILPGYPSYVCLSDKLLAGNEVVHQFVFRTLLNRLESIPADSKMHVTGLVCYLEELLPPEALPLPEPEIVIISRAMRMWRFSFNESDYRLIGRVAG